MRDLALTSTTEAPTWRKRSPEEHGWIGGITTHRHAKRSLINVISEMTCDHQPQGAAVLKQTFPTARVHWKWKLNLCSLYEKLHGSSVQLNWNQKNRESKTLKPGLAHHIRINEVLFQRNTVGSENGKSEIQNLIWNKGFKHYKKSLCRCVKWTIRHDSVLFF